MKNFIKFIAITLVLFFASCEKDNSVDPIFDSSINERTEELKAEYSSVLAGNAYGWIGYYSPNEDVGAWTLLLDFDSDGNVVMKSDYNLGGNDATITYRIDKTLKIELVFETHSVLHEIFETNNNDFGGEFVFNMLEVNSDAITLQSKTDSGYGGQEVTILTLTPATATDWDLGSVTIETNLQQDLYKSVFRNVQANGIAIATFSYNEISRTATISYVVNDEIVTVERIISVSETGFSFLEPVIIGFVTLSSFEWNDTSDFFEDSANNVTIDYDNVPVLPLSFYDFGGLKNNGRYNYLEESKSSKAFVDFYDSYTQYLVDDYGIVIYRWYMRDLQESVSNINIYIDGATNLRYYFTYEIDTEGKVNFTLTGDTNVPDLWEPLIQPLIDVMIGSSSGYYIKDTGGLLNYSNGTFSLINADEPKYEINYYDF